MTSRLIRTGDVEFEDLWSSFATQDRRFRRILKRVFVTLAVIGLIVPWLPTREPTVAKKVQVMTRLAKVMTEKKAPPPPPPKEENIGAKSRDKEGGGGVEHPAPASAADKAAIRRKVANKGVLAFRKELNQLREASVLSALTNENVIAMTAPESHARSEKDTLTNRALRLGGGDQIKLPGNSVNSGVALANRQATRIEWIGTNEGRGGGSDLGAKKGKRGRSNEEIDWVVQRILGTLQLLYNRELRTYPDRRGKVAVRMTIAPNGQVTACQIASSELNLPDFENKVVVKIKSLDFGAKDVESVTLIYPIDFVPAND